jgi:hypothetical protein
MKRSHHGHNCMVVGFTTTHAISVYHHWCQMFEYCSWWGVCDATLSDKVCQWLATGCWFSPGTSVSYINKTDCHKITEILLKVTLNTITPPIRSLIVERVNINTPNTQIHDCSLICQTSFMGPNINNST